MGASSKLYYLRHVPKKKSKKGLTFSLDCDTIQIQSRERESQKARKKIPRKSKKGIDKPQGL
jgi:hypothetical protein